MFRNRKENERIVGDYIEGLHGQPASSADLGRLLGRRRQRAHQLLVNLHPNYPRLSQTDALRKVRAKQRATTEENIEAHLKDDKKSGKEIAQLAGISEYTVSRYFTRKNIKRGKGFFQRRQSKILDEKVAEYKGSNLSLEEIAQKIGGTSVDAVSRSLRRQGKGRGRGAPGRPRKKNLQN